MLVYQGKEEKARLAGKVAPVKIFLYTISKIQETDIMKRKKGDARLRKESPFINRPSLQGRLLLIFGIFFLLVGSGWGAYKIYKIAANKNDTTSYAIITPSTLGSQTGFLNLFPPRVKEAYEFAIEKPEVLEYIPCFCGCGSIGHMSNKDCYVKHTKADGSVILDNHGTKCELCVEITLETKDLLDKGNPLKEIRRIIDQNYSGKYAPGTDTSPPPG